MTYEGVGAILLRCIGIILIGAVLVYFVPAVAMEGSAATRSQLILTSSLLLLPAVVLVILSKPLGKMLAAGLE